MQIANLKNLFAAWVLLLVIVCAASGETIYVNDDAGGANNGTSWTDAYTSLRSALIAAGSGDQIWVAAGTYKPGNSRSDSFQMKNGVAIYGGFAGNEDPNSFGLADRDFVSNETILSGDLDGNDIDVNDLADLWGEPSRAENSYHVVVARDTDESAVLDGFTITGGNANLFFIEIDSGGGMYNWNSSPTVANCIFKCNSAGNDGLGGGGGMYNNWSNPTLTNCIFSNNLAGYNSGGGGVYNYYSNPILTNCMFSGNITEYCGGGMYNQWGNPVLTDCTFTDNFSPYRGGGIFNSYGSFSPVLTNCTFISNHSDEDGGAIYNFSVCSATVTKCTFSGNSAAFNGGGIYNGGNFNTTITSCLFTGNSAGQNGGGIYNYGGDWTDVTTVTNSTFIGNFALNGNTLACDSFYQDYPSSVETTNCILWDGENGIWNNDGSTITITCSDVRGGQNAIYDPCEAVVWGPDNIDADPIFAKPGYWADANDTNIIVEPNDPNAVWIDGDYHLKSQFGRWDPNSQTWVTDANTSPCIDAGDANSDWTTELWPHGRRINMGVYGGTPEASMSLLTLGNTADLNINGLIYYPDMVLLTAKWLYTEVLLPEDLNRDGIVNFRDFAIFTGNWEPPQLPPGQATNPNPTDEATLVDINAKLSWTAGPNTISHDVYLGTTSPGTFLGNQIATTFDPGTMAEKTTYYWRIDEVNPIGTTTGTVWSFTTGPPPGQASNPYPRDGATEVDTDVDLRWTAGPNAVSHDVYFGPSNPPRFKFNKTATVFSLGTLITNITYYWRIDEVEPNGTIVGAVWTFKTKKGLPEPATNPNPANSATGVSPTAYLFWMDGFYAMSHDVYFGTSSPPPFIRNQFFSTTFDPCTMAYNTTYYWRIDEVNLWGTTTGTVWSFTTMVLKATNPNPADGATEVSTTADLSWTAGADATSHDVYFGTSSSPPFIRNQTDTIFDPGEMTMGTTYYWRIDEVSVHGTTTGTVWTFTAFGPPP